MKRHVSLVFIIVNFLVIGLSFAQDSQEPAESANGWKGEAELGLVTTNGNTKTTSLNTKTSITHERNKWRHNAQASALNTSDATNRTAERYLLSAKSDFKVTKQNYFFVTVQYEKDLFSGYEYRISESLGFGRRVLDRDAMTLDLEIGPGARQSKLENASRANEATILGALKYAWKVSETSKFTEDISIETGEDATLSKSVTALLSQIAGSLAMKLSYMAKNTSKVPPGIKKTDSEFAATLVYHF